MTVRRDLQKLEQDGVLVRTHGGAVVRAPEQDAAYGIREQAQREEKAAIARRAVTLIRDNETIILDAGTTTVSLARLLHGRAGLTVITNSLYVLRELGGDANVTLIATGGAVRDSTFSFCGFWAEEMLSRFHADRLFLAATAIDPELGLFNSNVYEIGIKQQMMRSARQVILLADHTKFGKQSTAKIADLGAISSVITDERISPDIVNALLAHSVDLQLAPIGT
jgi:DeoR/GlpR family transcriptional regulator of sugar metabolism